MSLQARKPGLADDRNFEQHWSVASWRSWNWPPKGATLNSFEGLQVVADEVAKRAVAANMAQVCAQRA